MKKKIKKNRSFQLELMLCFLSITIVTVLIFAEISVKFSVETLKEIAKEEKQLQLEQVGKNLENIFSDVEDLLDVSSNHLTIEPLINQSASDDAFDGMSGLLNMIMNTKESLYCAALLDPEGNCVAYAPDKPLNQNASLGQKRWFKQIQNTNEDFVIIPHVQNMLDGEYQWVITCARPMKDVYGQKNGYTMIIDLDFQVIAELLNTVDIGKQGYLYLLDQEGRFIYHPQQQLIFSGEKSERVEAVNGKKNAVFYKNEQGDELLYISYPIENTGWTLVGVQYKPTLPNASGYVQVFFFSVANELMVLALFVSLILSHRITKPIKHLKESMTNAQQGDFQPVLVEVKGNKEVAELCDAYNHMVTYTKELMDANIQKTKEQQASELRALQAQINPHFLYNTLDSIIWSIETDESEDAIRMTAALAKFFQKAISNQDVFITIEEELDYTRQYLIIQRMRYKDKIDFSIQVDQDIMMCRIVKLLLQPLVENSLYHGLKYKKGKGLIQISGYKNEDKKYLIVSDNGIGMDEMTLARLFEQKEDSKGIGLSNVKNRIQLYYGNEFGVSVDSEKGIGTTVTIVIPCETEKNVIETGYFIELSENEK